MALRRIRLNPVPQDKAKTRNILYVEDEDDNWDVARLALGKQYELTRAKTAQEAFKVLSQSRFDIILMDIQLSGSALDGIEITKILRGKYEKQPPDFADNVECHDARIIFVTAYSAKYKRKELIGIGGDELITKPVDFTRLSLAISRLVVREAFDQQVEVKKMLEKHQLTEQREDVRVGVELDCFVTHDETLYATLIDNLSVRGARVEFGTSKRPPLVKPGDCLKVSFYTSWGRIEAEANIAWADMSEHGVLGLEFTQMSDESSAILNRWLSFGESTL